ncbi:isopenicillin N synthase family oxygenase [Telmatospirillum sp. J64-1]|uniref:isopenicillin N synthase family dioxygenase n=1 Tax=Telmatospirillum sp. J64-1 TaxID=2502183 RepID=UPI00115F408C|nr:2-oxoglutarate and iron-dependent oxygenase domain-containing protein [Telmatospirillum sp. J64-1]
MISPVRTASREEVPVLDLAPLTHGGPIDDLAKQLDRACREIGFFYVYNHGVDESVFNNVFEATRRYFALPEDVRQGHLMHPIHRRGFMPQGINQHPGYVADLKESYEIGVDLPPDDPDVLAGLPLHAPNQWPDDLPWLRDASEAYFDQTKALGERLLKLIAKALDLDEGFFLQYTKKPMVQMRLFHYPPQPAVSPDNAFGVAPHTDYGMITLLAQDPIGGLELRKRDGEWIAAPYIEGTLVVNIGDLFQRWTNDLYVSNPHRVVNRTGKERYSIPMFYNLDYDAPVSCLPTCCSADNPPRHAPIKSGDYLVQRFRTVQKYKAEEEVA